MKVVNCESKNQSAYPHIKNPLIFSARKSQTLSLISLLSKIILNSWAANQTHRNKAAIVTRLMLFLYDFMQNHQGHQLIYK
jgi:hypothetical protein